MNLIAIFFVLLGAVVGFTNSHSHGCTTTLSDYSAHAVSSSISTFLGGSLLGVGATVRQTATQPTFANEPVSTNSWETLGDANGDRNVAPTFDWTVTKIFPQLFNVFINFLNRETIFFVGYESGGMLSFYPENDQFFYYQKGVSKRWRS